MTFFIVFLAIAVVGRAILQYIATGNHGIRPGNYGSPAIVIISSLLLLISFFVIAIVVTFDAMGMIESRNNSSSLPSIAGSILSILGITLTTISQHQMGPSWRIGVDPEEKTKLITNGIYAYVRNPIYSGVLLFCFGLLLLLPNLFMLLSVIMVYASIELHVRYVEEPYLRQLHTNEYVKYICKTGRYFPSFKKNEILP